MTHLGRLRGVFRSKAARRCPGGRIVLVRHRLRGLRGGLNKVGSVGGVPKTVFIVSSGGRRVTMTRTRGLRVPIITAISAGYSPSIISFPVPTGSSTVHTMELLTDGVTSTVLRNHRKRRRRIRAATTSRRTRRISRRTTRRWGLWCERVP